MVSIESIPILMLAPVAGAAAWLVASRGRRARLVAGLGAAVSTALVVAGLAGVFTGEKTALRVFLVDVSASTRGTAAAAWPAIRSAAAKMPGASRVAVVAFGRDTALLLAPTRPAELPADLPPPSGVYQDGTSFEAALDAAGALLASHGGGDAVLVTDGCETEGDGSAAALRLAAAGRRVHSLTLRASTGPDAWVAAVRAPASVAAGGAIDFEVIAGATEPMHGKLVLLVNGRELAGPEPVDVMSRGQVFARRASAAQPGLYTLTARLMCPDDAASENDEASASVRVRGKLAVTVVSSGGGGALAAVLEGSPALAVRRARPDVIEPTSEEMLASDVIVLDNVSSVALGAERQEWLRRFVSDAGRGLAAFGGRDSFGAGGYAKTALADLLPVDVDPERRAAKPTSVAIVADRSGSMAEMVGGQAKIEFVREAVLRAAREFGGRSDGGADELSVVAFNQAAEVLLERERAGTAQGAESVRIAVAKLFPSGRTQISPALEAARTVLARSGLKRHIILVSDGQGQDKLDGARIADEMKAGGIALSVLATGKGMNEGLTALKGAVEATAGRFVLLDSISELPAAMARETRAIAGPLVREGEFAVARGPGDWLGAVPALPPVKGYVLTGARPEAPPVLVTGDAPLVAGWRRGLGRAAACTTSLDEWAEGWRAPAADMVRRIVLWAGGGARQEAVAVRMEPTDGRIRIEVRAAASGGASGQGVLPALAASVFAPDGTGSRVELKQVGRGRYEGWVTANARGTYVASVSAPDGAGALAGALGEGQVTLGYSAEWRPDADPLGARRVSALTSGLALRSLSDLPPLEPAAGPGEAGRNVAYILLCAAAAVFIVAALRG